VNEALDCIQDTLRNLIEEAKESVRTSLASRGTSQEAFAVGRAEALAEVLHTWMNQLRTFGLEAQLGRVLSDLNEFLGERGLATELNACIRSASAEF